MKTASLKICLLTGTAIAAILISHVITVSNAQAQTLTHTLDDPTPTNADNFGSSVAISDNRLLIGAPHHDRNGINAGQAHLFDAVTGNLLQTFDDPTPTGSDKFGGSVAISGNSVLIGANGSNRTNGLPVGQAYLFDATTGNLLHTFDDPTPTVFDIFGSSVAISDNNVLIGAPFDDTNGDLVGQAHLFDAVTGNLLFTFNDPTVTATDSFGGSVAISGNNVLIGAVGDDTNGDSVGQAHLYSIVPEPSSIALIITTFFGLTFNARKRIPFTAN